jgi:predicted choloylglycine hydrolase
MMTDRLGFRAIRDAREGTALRSLIAQYWPAYQRWMRRAPHVTLPVCLGELRSHMPELVPSFERLLDLGGGGDALARFLTLYCPPRVVGGCSQLVLDDNGPVLIRSYDHHPKLFDGIVLASEWTGRPTLALSDCIWGALDGINSRGLAVALAFGGRNTVGPGFAAPLITRYLLETCETIAQAMATLSRIPVYMSYTLVVVDAAGEFVTAHIGPDRSARFLARRTSTNHQSPDDWPAYCRHTASVERLSRLESMFSGPLTAAAAVKAFLQPPLWRTTYERGSGTLYVAEYRPITGQMTLHWPGSSESFSADNFIERTLSVPLAPAVEDRGE